MDRNPAQEGRVEHQIQISPSLVRIYIWARTYWWEISLSFLVTITVLGLIAGGVIHFRAGKDESIGPVVKDSLDNSPTKFCILIRKGVYHENIIIGRNKPNLVLMGEGKQNTVITSNQSNSAYNLTHSATLCFLAVENWAKPSIFYKCCFVGYQATLKAQKGWQFYHSCEIQGTKCYVFVDASAYFQNCQIKTTRNIIPCSTPCHGWTNPLLDTGFIFHGCDFLTTQFLPEGEESAEAQTYLAGSVAAYSRTVFLLSSMDASMVCLVQKSARNAVYCQEFNNQRPNSSSYNGTSINSFKAAQFSLRVFLEGDQWIPTYVPYTLDFFQ